MKTGSIWPGAWAELAVLTLESETPLPASTRRKMSTLQVRIDEALVSWLKKRYAGLFNLPPTPPVMLHHVPPFPLEARHRRQGTESGAHRRGRSVAGPVDHPAPGSWSDNIRGSGSVKTRSLPGYPRSLPCHAKPSLRESHRFTFPRASGPRRRKPRCGRSSGWTRDSRHRKSATPRDWVTSSLIASRRVLPKPGRASFGLVVDKVDRIMHGMQLGSAGMHNQVRQWAGQTVSGEPPV